MHAVRFRWCSPLRCAPIAFLLGFNLVDASLWLQRLQLPPVFCVVRPTLLAQGVYYAYPPQGAPAQQQPFAVAGAQPVAAAPAAAAPGIAYPGQHIRYDDKGNPTWGGSPFGAPPR